jgi:hypothetical protein
MSNPIRRAIYFLMITLVINAGGWTFNKEAVADVWFDEQWSMAADIDYSPGSDDIAHAVSSKSPCNHWCHAVGHFMGVFTHESFVMPEFASEQFSNPLLVINHSFPDGHFRPPRLSA